MVTIRTNSLTGAVWLVACLAPGEIAPHPNFSVTRTDSWELLALLAQSRWRDYEHYRDLCRNDDEGLDLVGAVENSLLAETQAEGARQLEALAGAGHNSGYTAAAALFAAVAFAELDDLGRSRDLLTAVSSRISGEPTSTSDRLIQTALQQQLALRAAEQRDATAAVRYARQVLELHERRLPASWETFRTSRGTKLRASTVQREVQEVLASNALSLVVSLEEFGQQSWVRAVRLPAPRGGMRALNDLASSSVNFVSAAYTRQVEPATARRTYYTEDPVLRPAQAALLYAELNGSFAATRRHRDLVAKYLVLREESSDRVAELTEAVRLLRQSDSFTNLRPLVRQLRNEGPLAALEHSAAAVLRRPGLEETVSRSDLAVLTHAADVLDEQSRERALEAAVAFGSGASSRHRGHDGLVPWAVVDEAVKAAATLLPDTGRDQRAAAEVLDMLVGARADEVLAGAAAEFAEAVDWRAVDSSTIAAWRAWVTPQDSTGADVLMSVRAAVPALDAQPSESGRAVFGLDRVVQVLDQLNDGQASDPGTLADIAGIATAALDSMIEAASRGEYSFGRYPPLLLATATADLARQPGLWERVVSSLLDPRVALRDKTPALEWLATHRPQIPDYVMGGLDHQWRRLLEGQTEPFLSASDEHEVAAWRMATAYGLVDQAAVQLAALERAGSQDPQRRLGAARLGESAAPADWAVVLLLQLSHDDVATVAATACRALVRALTSASELRLAIIRRLASALGAEGTLVPLLVLRGLRELLTDTPNIPEELARRIEELRSQHPSRLVREAAGQAVPKT